MGTAAEEEEEDASLRARLRGGMLVLVVARGCVGDDEEGMKKRFCVRFTLKLLPPRLLRALSLLLHAVLSP